MTTKAHQVAVRMANDAFKTLNDRPLTPEQQAQADIWEAAWIKACQQVRRTGQSARIEPISHEEARAFLEARRPKTEGAMELARALDCWRRAKKRPRLMKPRPTSLTGRHWSGKPCGLAAVKESYMSRLREWNQQRARRAKVVA